MPAEDVPKNRGWFRKILTLGRGNPKDPEKPEPDAEPGDAGIEGKYHRRISAWEDHAEKARDTPDQVLKVVKKWISETS
ncbi:MAG: hypothetical protein VXZ12_14160 [SAR324 cluster bacterium]|nr:hypothetical protein [SAR324 cluster bacterium]